MCDKGIPIILVSLAILFVPVKSGAEIPAAESSEIVHQLELIRLEIAQQGRRIATLEHASAVAGQTPNYHVVAPTQPAGHHAKSHPPTLLTTGKNLHRSPRRQPLHHRQTPRRLDRFDRRGQPARLRRQNQKSANASRSQPNRLPNPHPRKGQLRPPAIPHPPQPRPTNSKPGKPSSASPGATVSKSRISSPTTASLIPPPSGPARLLRIPGTRSSQETVVSTSRSKQPTTAPAAKGAKDGKHTIVRGESLTRIRRRPRGLHLRPPIHQRHQRPPIKSSSAQTLILPGSGVVAKKITTKTTATKVATHTPTTRSVTTPTPQPTAPRTEDLGVDDFMGYFVVSGDTVESIASIFNTSASRLRRINDIPSGGQFRAGDQILVPADAVFSS